MNAGEPGALTGGLGTEGTGDLQVKRNAEEW